MDLNNNEYNYERLESCILQLKNLRAKESTSLILEDIKSFTKGAEQSDDITLMIVSLK